MKRRKEKAVLQMVSMPISSSKKKTNGRLNGNGHSSPEETGVFLQATLPPFVEKTTTLDGMRGKVFLDRYSMKDASGESLEKHPEQMWWRVANGIAHEEKTPQLQKFWAKEFYKAMENFKFVPAGRILSGAGTGFEVTFFNCYVIPSPKDSRGGIMENITHTVEIQARGGGVGINLSSLRPHGARVKKVNGTSSGPVSWASLYSAANHDVIQQGGSRRGALMLMLHDWHPDVIEFIHVKEDLTKIPGANLSICVSDKFMDAVKQDAQWITKFPDITDPDYDSVWDGDIEKWESLGKKVIEYGTYSAKDIWDQICNAAWRSAEPGLHFLERSNKWSNTWYFEKLLSTNPCLTGDTWIHTSQGSKQVRDLVGIPFMAKVDGKHYFSTDEGFFRTGQKLVFSLQTYEGYLLRLTAEHKVKRVKKLTRYTTQTEWAETQDLQKGDKILLNNHRQNTEWEGKYSFTEGYLMGLLIGDGTLRKDKAILSVWQPDITGSGAVMSEVSQMVQTFFPRSDFAGWMAIAGRNEYRLSTAKIKHLAQELGMDQGKKTITPSIERTSSEFHKGLLRGLFDTDGSVQGTQAKGVSVRLAQSNLKLLEAVQRMLLRLGIVSHIYQNRRIAGTSILPDGKGGEKEYSTKAQHELIISGDNLLTYQELIGFKDSKKSARLRELLRDYRRVLNRERFVATVEQVRPDGIEDVYDAQIPTIHAFDANGIMAHNCGEQPLGAWAVCNLGAMNLAAFVNDEGVFDYSLLEETTKVAMRFMDNVVDANYYFYDENEKKAKEIRRTGIGTMGLGDALIKMKIRYGSNESLKVMDKIYSTIRDASYETSSDLAKEKGSFPKFEAKKYLQGHFIKGLPEHIQEKIAKQGIRNAVILTQAPTGTTSLLSGVSSGIEPVYDFAFVRTDRTGTSTIYHPLYQVWRDANPGAEVVPDYFVTANDLTPEDHVKVQAVVQGYTDSSISKTVNAPNSHSVDDVKKLYMMAYELGCKGVTYFRDGSRTGVLAHMEEKKEETEPSAEVFVSRPMILRGRTYRMQTPLGEAFVTINRDERNQPFEVFVTIGKGGMHTMADAEAIGRLVSLSLRLARAAGSLSPKEVAQKIVSQLRGIGGASHVGFGKDRVMSLADAIAKTLSEDIAVNETEEQAEQVPLNLPEASGKDDQDKNEQLKLSVTKQGDLCPECGAASFVMEEGCQKCYSCGYSKC